MASIPVLNPVALCVDQDGKSKPPKIKAQQFFVAKTAEALSCGLRKMGNSEDGFPLVRE